MAPGVASRARAPQAGSTQDWGSPGSSAAAPPLPKDRDDGHGARRHRARARPAFQTGDPGSSTRPASPAGQRRAASAAVDGTCAASLTGLCPSPPRRQARAAHLDARGCGSRGLECAVSSHRSGRTQVRRARLRGTGRRPLLPSQPQAGPGDPAVCARSRGGPARGWAP